MNGLAGVSVLAVSLVYLPPEWVSLQFFDSAKRVVWALFLVTALVVVAFRTCRLAPKARPLFGALVILTLWMAGRALFRPDPWVELESLQHWLLAPLAVAVGLCIAPPTRTLVRLVGVAVGLQSLLMVGQYYGFDPLFAASTGDIALPSWRMMGTIGYHNQAAAFIAVGALFVAAHLRCEARGGMLVAWVLLVTGLTASRGATLALVLAVAAAVVLLLNHRGVSWTRTVCVAGVITAATIAGLLLMSPGLRHRVGSLAHLDRAEANVGSRVAMAKVAWALWSERPLTGWGAGAFASQYLERLGAVLPETKTTELLVQQVFAREAHNDYLQFMAEFGLIGVGLLGGVLWFAGRLIRSADTPLHARWCALSLLVFMGVLSALEFPWQTAAPGPLAGLLWGITLAGSRTESPYGRDGSRAFRWGLAWMLLLATGCLVVGAVTLRLDFLARTCTDRVAVEESIALLQRCCPWTHRQQALLGARLAASGDYGKAVSVLEHAARGFKDTATLNNLGFCYGKLGRWNDAARVYEVWARSGLRYEEAVRNLVVALQQSGQYGRGADALRALSRTWREGDRRLLTAEFTEQYIYLLERAGRIDAALEWLLQFERRAGAERMSARLYRMLGRLYQEKGREEEARAAFAKALPANPAPRPVSGDSNSASPAK